MKIDRTDLDFLHAAGANFVLLRGKEPIHKWVATPRKTAAEALAHVQRGGQLAVVPRSVANCVVVDIDGTTGEDSMRVACKVTDWIGFHPDGWYASQSGNGRHLWYRCGTCDAPLGYRTAGRVRTPRQLSGGLQWDTPVERFDLRWGVGYVRIDSYAHELAADMRGLQNDPATAPMRLSELDERGQSYKFAGGLFG